MLTMILLFFSIFDPETNSPLLFVSFPLNKRLTSCVCKSFFLLYEFWFKEYYKELQTTLHTFLQDY